MIHPTTLEIEAPGAEALKNHRHGPGVLFWLLVAVVTVFGVYVLPLAFPPLTYLRSSSYIVGFNNRLAAIDAALISLVVTALLVWRNFGARVSTLVANQRMPMRWLGIAVAAAVVFTSALGSFVVRADVNYTDIGYWQHQISRWSHGAKLYRDFEFAYGPILFYWPAYIEKGLSAVGVRPVAGFMVSQGLMQVLGIAILFYLLQQLPLSRRLRGIAFAAICFATLTPLLGINYTLTRFAIAYAALLWIAKKSSVWLQAILFAFAECLMLGISPEIGIAFAAGVFAYAVYRGVATERRWLVLALVPVLAFGLFAAWVDRNYFFTMSNFSKGLVNEIVEPFLNIHIFLFSTVILSPFAIAGYIRRFGREAGPIVGMYVASLAMVPSALGRCDVLHVFFSWIGLFLLSLIGLDASRDRWAKISLGVLLVMPLWTQGGLICDYWPLLTRVTTQGASTGGFDLAKLEHVTAGEKVYLPVMAPQFVYRALEADGQLQPSYFSYTMNAETVPNLERKFAEMHQAEYVLMPVGTQEFIRSRVYNNWKFRIFRLGYSYRRKHPLFDTAEIISEELQKDYVPIDTYGTTEHEIYTLYRRK